MKNDRVCKVSHRTIFTVKSLTNSQICKTRPLVKKLYSWKVLKKSRSSLTPNQYGKSDTIIKKYDDKRTFIALRVYDLEIDDALKFNKCCHFGTNQELKIFPQQICRKYSSSFQATLFKE